MPDHNPFIERHHGDAGLLAYVDPRPLFDYATVVATEVAVNPMGSPQAQNAAGTSEDVALHVALIAAFALVGVWALRSSGFKFVVAGSIG